LTEIKLAAELLWRVGVKPEQVCLGFGFYGRSFELSDPSCTTPGCPFSGGARPGPCSDTSGVLMYYEIQAIIDQVDGLQPIQDDDAAVKILVFDDDQWVSYDDDDTFATKLAWANTIGFGGSLIWAVDTDDDKYSAMSSLLGKEISHPDLSLEAFDPTRKAIIQNLVGENGQDCKLMKNIGCVDPDIVRCPDGMHKVGWDKDGCSVSSHKNIRPPSAQERVL
jgi:chitinase